MPAREGLVAVLGAAVVALSGCAQAATGPVPTPVPVQPAGDQNAVLSGLAFFPLADPDPVAGADGRPHLAYEPVAMNQSDKTIMLQRIEVLDTGRGQVLPSTCRS